MNFKEKLEKEKNDVTEKKSKAISNAVMNALMTFCEQEQEFAQAIESAVPTSNSLQS